jgi:hypothetical protein
MRRRAPELGIAAFLGHLMPSMRTTGRYLHVAPDYLANARTALEDLQEDIAREATRAMAPDSAAINQRAGRVLVAHRLGYFRITKSLKSGAGKGIRMLDPNLGKGAVKITKPSCPGARRLVSDARATAGESAVSNAVSDSPFETAQCR